MKKFLLAFIVLCCLSCGKDDESLGDLVLEVEVVNVNLEGAQIRWFVNGDRTPEDVSFKVMLDEFTAEVGYRQTVYNFNNLDQNTEYTVTIIATRTDGLQQAQAVTFTTLLNTIFNGNLTIDTQQKADDFIYTEVRGTLFIRGSEVTDISNLASLVMVEELVIYDTDLASLSGLEGLNRFYRTSHSRSGITLWFNDVLTDVSALSGLAGTTLELRLLFNPLLQDLEGLGLADIATKLEIRSTPVNDLSYFSNVRELDDLLLTDATELQSFQGLDNLESLFELGLSGDLQFTNFEGLESLNRIRRFVVFENLDSLESFNGLENLETILGSLQIRNCNNLTSLAGLSSLRSLSGFFKISDCQNLQTLAGPPMLNSVGGPFFIESMPALTAVEGFDALVTIEGDLNLTNCSQLESINGFSGLRTLEDVNITDLENLMTIEGFSNLNALTDLRLFNLPVLNDLQWLNGLIRVNNDLQIYDVNVSSLNGLNGLERVHNLLLYDVPIADLTGLENLSLVENLDISQCSSLTSLYGIAPTNDLDPNDIGTLSFQNNSSLTDYCSFTDYVNNVVCLWTASGNAYNPTKPQVESTSECSI
ncbi:MAG: hypothetical protein AAF466_00300 [Bacteroidota bacterium]